MFERIISIEILNFKKNNLQIYIGKSKMFLSL